MILREKMSWMGWLLLRSEQRIFMIARDQGASFLRFYFHFYPLCIWQLYTEISDLRIDHHPESDLSAWGKCLRVFHKKYAMGRRRWRLILDVMSFMYSPFHRSPPLLSLMHIIQWHRRLMIVLRIFTPYTRNILTRNMQCRIFRSRTKQVVWT